MSGLRTPRQPKAEAPRFYGFLDNGSMLRSSVEVDNGVTRIARQLMASLTRDLLPPSLLVVEISRTPEFFRTALSGDTTMSWARIERFDQWPLAPTSRSLEEWFRSQGNTYPWLRDVNAWTRSCDLAEQRHGYGSRKVRPGNLSGMLQEIGEGF